MKALIDADVLRYQIGFASQWTNDDGDLVVEDFEDVKQRLDTQVEIIQEETGAYEEPTLYLTYDSLIHNWFFKRGLAQHEIFKPNFREAIARTAKYKGNRVMPKPEHFANITSYILNNYEVRTKEGLEADDLLTIDQIKATDEVGINSTVICSVDKDLRITPGLHYTWGVGKRPAIPMVQATRKGWLEPKYKGELVSGAPKLIGLNGYGMMFFGAQLLMGDTVDNIKGVPKCGPGKAFKLLGEVDTPREMFTLVAEEYKKAYGDDWKEVMLEMGRLLWMTRELNEDGSPVLWELPKYVEEM